MLTPLAPNLWHATHAFTTMGIPVTSRMTVVRCADGGLWLHSPIPIAPVLKRALDALGPVRWIVAPNLAHYLFAGHAHAVLPQAQLFGAPGLRDKRPDLFAMQELPTTDQAPWQSELDQVFVQGIPLMNETVWFHRASGTVVLTDLCMWFTQVQAWQARIYGQLSGVMKALVVARMVRLTTRDKAAAARSGRHILQWPIERVVVAHDCVLEVDAKQQLAHALAWFEKT